MIALSGRNPGLVAVQHPLEFASLRKVRYAFPYLTRFRGIQFEHSNGSILTGNIRYALLVRGANVLRQTEHHGSIPPNFWSQPHLPTMHLRPPRPPYLMDLGNDNLVWLGM